MIRALLVVLALLPGIPAAAQSTSITGEITRADFETYREVPFRVPADATRVTVRLTYDKADRTVVDLGLWDAERFRGWSGGTRDRVTVALNDASPGYLPGPLPAGRWKVVMGVPNIRAGVRARYRIDIAIERGGRATGVAPIATGRRWYRGDFHMHGAHSDGSCATRSRAARVPCPLFRTVEAAAAAGLDFVSVTDHNTVAHWNGLVELQPWFDRMLLIPGIEVTTFGGHANAIGPSRQIDFRLATRRGIRALQDDVAAAGGILSVNHPALPSGEICMGCGWTWRDTDWSRVTAIEVINGLMAQPPLSGQEFWYARLNEGHRLTGIGGSDSHDPDAPAGKPPIGRPTTVVRADALSQRAILNAVRAGEVFIDVEGSRDRLLEVEAQEGAAQARMGGELPAVAPIAVAARVKGAAGTEVELVIDGVVAQRKSIAGDDDRPSFTIAPGKLRRWFAINVRRAGALLLIGNPIYRGAPR